MAFDASAWIHVETGNREELRACCCYHQVHQLVLQLERYGLVWWMIFELDDDNHDGMKAHSLMQKPVPGFLDQGKSLCYYVVGFLKLLQQYIPS